MIEPAARNPAGEPRPGRHVPADGNAAPDIERMEAVLLGLPRLTREIFLAARLDDLGYREIARRTGLSLRSVERHIARTIVALDRALSRSDPP